MKIVIASSFVPFVKGGGRYIVEWLEQKLLEYGHQVEKFYLPFDDHHSRLLDNLLSYRLLRVGDQADRLIAIRPPAHSLQHPNKVVWFIHHLRGYYDLANTEHSSIPNTGMGRAVAAALRRHDTESLLEARAIFTNSTVVQNRLKTYNALSSEVLYPPLFDSASYYCGDPSDEIITVCRVENHKRQDLLVRAMKHVRTPVKLRICGASSNPSYVKLLHDLVRKNSLQERVAMESGWIAEERKIDLVSNCLASAYAPLDEDSYGYPTLEAAAARKPTLTTWDAGGTLEFVRDGENGLITEPTPEAIAVGFDRMFADRKRTAAMGDLAYDTVVAKNITWDHVIDRLLA
ncbi:MAG: glycosyltransferase family 4 protein [Planctomycetales bacterium]|nr:glycosyltransferase family 4 protein [Planctomycetales bacterium]